MLVRQRLRDAGANPHPALRANRRDLLIRATLVTASFDPRRRVLSPALPAPAVEDHLDIGVFGMLALQGRVELGVVSRDDDQLCWHSAPQGAAAVTAAN